MKKCPYCAEEIQDEAIVCRYCGRDLQTPVTPPPVSPAPKQVKQTAKVKGKKQPYLLATVLIVCICCGITRAFGSSNKPTSTPRQTGADKVVISTSTEDVVISTFTPVSTSTNVLFVSDTPVLADISLHDYPSVAAQRLETLQSSWDEFVLLHDKLTADISVATDDNWRQSVQASLLRVQTGIHEIASMQIFPPAFSFFNQIILKLEKEMLTVFPDYTLALEQQDQDALVRAAVHVEYMKVYMRQASHEMTRLRSLPAPRDTPLPTFTPRPTFTHGPILTAGPTSVNTGSNSTGYDQNGDGKVTCADFKTQAAAQKAYRAGYTNLDGNDNDGKACESLP